MTADTVLGSYLSAPSHLGGIVGAGWGKAAKKKSHRSMSCKLESIACAKISTQQAERHAVYCLNHIRHQKANYRSNVTNLKLC